ncbi:SNARE domain protein [Talaromyces proteolyticus]|uniref:SNARE domain protein n=1 Tax=Talaromyces proteolyticus TaxID=1131652 RepID=A0AAD4PY60_9EURO|nr:SNARE domain protein [Talaromyces proteolyticus]KAH8694285.1 SNARE domain protein [Talaromyces proteolyticus]
MNGNNKYGDADLERGQDSYELKENYNSTTREILDQCRRINTEIAKLRQKRERQLHTAQQAVLDSSNGATDRQTRRSLDIIESEIMQMLQQTRSFLNDLKENLQRNHDSSTMAGVSTLTYPQVGLVGRNLEEEVQQLRKSQVEFDRTLRDQVRRRYEIANSTATSQEIDSSVENVMSGQIQVFQSTQGGRRQGAMGTHLAVVDRSAAIRKIEDDLISLSHVSQEVSELVQRQEPMIEEIDKNAQVTQENIVKANDNLIKAIFSAKNARRYKWYILLVCLTILAVVIAVPVAWCEVNHACGAK